MIRIFGSRLPSAESTDALGCGGAAAVAAGTGCAGGVPGLGISETIGPGADEDDADDAAGAAGVAAGAEAADGVAVGGSTGSSGTGTPPGGTRFLSNLHPCLYVWSGVGLPLCILPCWHRAHFQ